MIACRNLWRSRARARAREREASLRRRLYLLQDYYYGKLREVFFKSWQIYAVWLKQWMKKHWRAIRRLEENIQFCRQQMQMDTQKAKAHRLDEMDERIVALELLKSLGLEQSLNLNEMD